MIALESQPNHEKATYPATNDSSRHGSGQAVGDCHFEVRDFPCQGRLGCVR
jgi:hypothetical protein